MGNFWHNRMAWLRSHTSRVKSEAVAWLMSASRAVVRPAYLVTMIAVLVPVFLLLVHSTSKATATDRFVATTGS